MQVSSSIKRTALTEEQKLQERIVDTILPSIGRGSVTDYDIPMGSKDEDEEKLVKNEDQELETNLVQRTSPMSMRYKKENISSLVAFIGKS